MKELANFITLVNGRIKGNGWVRLVYYIVVTAILLAAFLLLPKGEIGFVYNEF